MPVAAVLAKVRDIAVIVRVCRFDVFGGFLREEPRPDGAIHASAVRVFSSFFIQPFQQQFQHNFRERDVLAQEASSISCRSVFFCCFGTSRSIASIAAAMSSPTGSRTSTTQYDSS